VGLEERATGVEHGRVDEAVADASSLGRQEAEAHGAPDEHLVGHLQQRLDHLQLVAHLGAAEYRHQGSPGSVADTEQHLGLTRQQTSRGRGHERWRPDDRGVGPVRGTKSVVDVGIKAVAEPADEVRVVGFLTRIEA
jgi:hypothetical protein